MAGFWEQISNSVSNSYETAQSAIRNGNGNPPGFTNLAPVSAPVNGAVRQSQIANNRTGTATRNLIRWFLPETGIIEMYINPKNIRYNNTKNISSPTRTRGGYSIQYWGENLGTISINGTTGSSGVEGINVLEDIYRNEQVSMDALAMAAEAARQEKNTKKETLSGLISDGISDIFGDINNVLNTGNIDPDLPEPTLASIAFQTEMYWSGWVFRGFFTSMSVTESTEALGLFDYTLEFTVTQKRGLRLNFMPWHRSAVNGPSNSNPDFGTPYSFGSLSNNDLQKIYTPKQAIDITAASIIKSLQSDRPF